MRGASAYGCGVCRQNRTKNWFTHWVKEAWISNSCPQVGNSTYEAAMKRSPPMAAWWRGITFCNIAECLIDSRKTTPYRAPARTPLRSSKFSLNTLSGGTRFAHNRRLQDDGAVAKITGMKKERLCGEDAFRRLCEKLDPAQVEKWFAPAEQIIHHAMPPNCVADWDSTLVVRYGKQEDTAIGYNPQKPGRPSHHPLACVIAGTRLCLHMEWRRAIR